MGYRQNAQDEGITRSFASGLPVVDGPFTAIWWVYFDALRTGSWTTTFSVGPTTFTGTDYISIAKSTADDTFRMGLEGTDLPASGAVVATTARWYCQAFRRELVGGVYVNTFWWDLPFASSRVSSSESSTLDIDLASTHSMQFGRNPWAVGEWHDGRFSNVKLFEAALRVDQIIAEAQRNTLVDSGLTPWALLPLPNASDLTDHSGNGRDFSSAAGGLTDVDDPTFQFTLVPPTPKATVAPASGGSASSPASTAIGDMVIVVTWERAGAGVPTHTLDSGNGYVEILSRGHNDGSTDGRLSVGYKIATSAGVNTYQAYTSSTGTPAWVTGLIILKAGTFKTTGIVAAGQTTTTNAAPNPPQVTSLTSTVRYLGLAIAGWHLGSSVEVIVTAPSGWIKEWDVAGASTMELACASLTPAAVTTIDPGAFTDDVAPNGSSQITIAIPGIEATYITPPVGALSLAGVAPTVQVTAGGDTITPPAGALAFAGAAPTVKQDIRITPQTGTLALTGAAPAVSEGTRITPQVGALALSGVAPVASEGTPITPQTGALTVTGVAPTVREANRITPPAGALAVTGAAPTVREANRITPQTGALVISGVAPTAQQGTNITPQTGALAVTGVTPVVSEGTIRVPPTGALALSGAAPTVRQDIRITPPVGALTFNGATPTVSQGTIITPSTGALVLSGAAPSVLQGTVRVPPTGALTLAGVAPTVRQDTRITPPVGALTFSGAAPGLAGNDHVITPPTGALTLTGQTPTVQQAIRIIPPTGALTLTGVAPTVRQGTVITPPSGALLLVGAAPALKFTITPGTGALTLAGAAPTVVDSGSTNTTITPPTGSLSFAGAAPSLDLGIRPGTGALTLSGTAPSLGAGVTPATGALALAGAAPVVRIGVQITPGTGALGLSGAIPQVGLGVVPPTGALALSGAAPALSEGVRVTPGTGALVLTGAAPTQQITGDVVITPGTGTLTLQGYVPTLQGAVPPPAPPEEWVTGTRFDSVTGARWGAASGQAWSTTQSSVGPWRPV